MIGINEANTHQIIYNAINEVVKVYLDIYMNLMYVCGEENFFSPVSDNCHRCSMHSTCIIMREPSNGSPINLKTIVGGPCH